MDQPVRSFPPDRADTRRLIGRVIVAVILGEAIWALIVSVMNNLIVPWLGDVMGQSSGLPTSFVQRPYNYPDLFVTIIEACIAGLAAAILNYFVQRPQTQRVKSVKSSPLAGPVRMFPESVKTPAPSEVLVDQPSPSQAVQHPVFRDTTPENQDVAVLSAEAVASAPEIKTEPVTPPSPPTLAPVEVARVNAPTPEMKAAPIAPPTPPAAVAPPAKPVQPSPKTVAAKPKKPKPVYYNIVGEPMPSDDE
jgi:large-conductance mechanosensitive channel